MVAIVIVAFLQTIGRPMDEDGVQRKRWEGEVEVRRSGGREGEERGQCCRIRKVVQGVHGSGCCVWRLRPLEVVDSEVSTNMDLARPGGVIHSPFPAEEGPAGKFWSTAAGSVVVPLQ